MRNVISYLYVTGFISLLLAQPVLAQGPQPKPAPGPGIAYRCFVVISKKDRRLEPLGKSNLELRGQKDLDLLRVSPSEYEQLRKNTVGSYFPNGEASKENIDKFYADMDKVIHNIQRMQGIRLPKAGRGQTPVGCRPGHSCPQWNGGSAARQDTRIIPARRTLCAQPAARPLGRGRRLYSSGVNTTLFPYHAAKWLGKFSLDQLEFGFKVGVIATIVGATFSIVTNPINNSITRYMNDKWGWLGVKLQMKLSDWQRASELKEQLEAQKNRLVDINRKYRMHGMSEEDAMKLWTQTEEVALLYAKELSSVVPDNIKNGRSFYWEGNVNKPLSFITAAAGVNVEKMTHEAAVREFERRGQQRKLTADEEKQLEFHRKQIAVSRSRMGSILAMWRVTEIMYPEYTRASFMEDPNGPALLRSYDTLMKGLHLDDYADEYIKEFERQLDGLGITLQKNMPPGAQKPASP